MPMLTNGGIILAVVILAAAAWMIWEYHHPAVTQPSTQAEQPARPDLDALPICVAEQVRFGPGYMLAAAIEHDRGQCTCTTADAELDQMIRGGR